MPTQTGPTQTGECGLIEWCRTLLMASIFALSAIGSAVAADPDPVKPGEFIPAKPPQPAPEIALTGLDGKAANLADFRGRPVILNLWATWCQPCLKEMPSLAKLPPQLGGDVALLAVSEDRGGAKLVEPFVAEHGLGKLNIYLDPKSAVGHAFGVRGLPTTILIDAKGEVLGRVEGAAEWDSPKMLEVVKPLLTAVSQAK